MQGHFISALLAFLAASPAFAQVAIEHQPDTAVWYDAATAARKAALLDEKALLALVPGKVDSKALAADLAKLDWIDAGSYRYADKALDTAYRDADVCELHLLRFLPDGGELHFSYAAKCSDKQHGAIEHTNFQMPPRTKVTAVKIGSETYLQETTGDEKALNRVVSYKDHVLIVDISMDGKRNSKRVSFRDVRVGIPRGFTWDPPAAPH